jgi:hypothetical protein
MYREVIESLSVVKDTKTSIAVVIVSFIVIKLSEKSVFELSESMLFTIYALLFMAFIRLVFSIISGVLYIGKSLKEQSDKKKELALSKDSIKKYFYDMDVYELYYLSKLKKSNIINIPKKGTAFNLLKSGLVRELGGNDKIYSIRLSEFGKEFMDNEGWGDIDNVKYNACIRYFSSLDTSESAFFSIYKDKDLVFLDRDGSVKGRSIKPMSYLYGLEKSIIFKQPVRDKTYKISDIAKKAILDTL